MNKIYLYIKTHRVTGMKYFGKTIKDPNKYYGSGTHWLRHLKKHGYDVTTEIYGCYADKQLAYTDALEFSVQHNIVESDKWANLRLESLDGGDTSNTAGYISAKKKMCENLKKCKWWNNGHEQSFSAFPPDISFHPGRLPFNNIGSKHGADKQRGKFWINNGVTELMTTHDIDGYSRGRIVTFGGKQGQHTIGSHWWNDTVTECMAILPPDASFIRGRLVKTSSSRNQR
jgi:hypothetical protein